MQVQYSEPSSWRVHRERSPVCFAYKVPRLAMEMSMRGGGRVREIARFDSSSRNSSEVWLFGLVGGRARE